MQPDHSSRGGFSRNLLYVEDSGISFGLLENLFFSSCVGVHCGVSQTLLCVRLHSPAPVGAGHASGARRSPRVQHSANEIALTSAPAEAHRTHAAVSPLCVFVISISACFRPLTDPLGWCLHPADSPPCTDCRAEITGGRAFDIRASWAHVWRSCRMSSFSRIGTDDIIITSTINCMLWKQTSMMSCKKAWWRWRLSDLAWPQLCLLYVAEFIF